MAASGDISKVADGGLAVAMQCVDFFLRSWALL